MLHSYFRYKARHNFLFDKYLNQVRKYYNLNPEDQERIKNEKFAYQFDLVYKKSEFYRNLYKSHGIIKSQIQNISDLNKLPIITKSEIKDNIDKVLIGSKIGKVKGYTSGTSGSPLTVYRNFKSIIKENAYLWNFRMKLGLNPRDKKVSIRGDLNRDELSRIDHYSNTLYISSYNLNANKIEKIVKLITEYQPKGLLGYPSSLYILGTEFEKLDKKYSIPLAFTSSEVLYDFQRELIEKTFQTKIYDWYGNSERTIAFEQCPNLNYHEVPVYSINEFQENSIITTSLINDIFPLIRYRINDTITLMDKTCSCGFESAVCERIEGRSDDILKLKDGTTIGSPGISTSFKKIAGIQYTQIIQENLNEIEVKLVINDEFGKQEEEKLIGNLKDRIGDSVKIHVSYVKKEELYSTRQGKYKLIINKLNN